MTPPLPSQITPGPDHAAPATPGGLVKKIKKTIVAVLGLAATLTAAGVLDDQAEALVTGILAVATAAGVYGVRNEPAHTVV